MEEDEETMLDSKDSKYIIGIDLGTTNSALSYFDTALAEEDGPSRQLDALATFFRSM